MHRITNTGRVPANMSRSQPIKLQNQELQMIIPSSFSQRKLPALIQSNMEMGLEFNPASQLVSSSYCSHLLLANKLNFDSSLLNFSGPVQMVND
ncbi:hypothetical protein Nepgr_021858 [Nepenthes gracilis]|uniref:Uncharacterized protein n=1 Tax=Nepenthes gracilis TaxID=150966 RepID=A0AAD3SZP3_NEPGR|nr:hypothetical protein Nepgr_021858 [Nepenthes gracilis]